MGPSLCELNLPTGLDPYALAEEAETLGSLKVFAGNVAEVSCEPGFALVGPSEYTCGGQGVDFTEPFASFCEPGWPPYSSPPPGTWEGEGRGLERAVLLVS